MSNDRTVHAACEDGREIVRYDRSGKWWIEYPGQRRPLSIGEAAAIAAQTHAGRGTVHFGKPGGRLFDKRVRDLINTPART